MREGGRDCVDDVFAPYHFRKAPAPPVQVSDKNSIRLEAEKKNTGYK